MTGTIINIITVLIGSALGVTLGGRLTAHMRDTVLRGLGLVTLVIGAQMAFGSANILIVLGSVLVGGLLGEWWGIEDGLQRLGTWLEARFNRGSSEGDDAASTRFIRGFVTASLLFCVGPMTILGSIQDGLTGDYRLLAIKAMLDGFAALAFSSSLGIGVAFSALVILVYQGSLSLLAAQAQAILSAAMITEMTATGGVLILGLAISTLLEIKPIRVGNYLPALILAPLTVWALTALGLPIAPSF
jgi:uncharacterized membrane protein YqgA involved in biofilm formation